MDGKSQPWHLDNFQGTRIKCSWLHSAGVTKVQKILKLHQIVKRRRGKILSNFVNVLRRTLRKSTKTDGMMSTRRVAEQLQTVMMRVLRKNKIVGSEAMLSNQVVGGGVRNFASGHSTGEGIVHGGLKLHATGGWHNTVGKGIAASMWFWVMYRMYHDYEGFLFGHAPHFEHELHHSQDGEHKDEQ